MCALLASPILLGVIVRSWTRSPIGSDFVTAPKANDRGGTEVLCVCQNVCLVADRSTSSFVTASAAQEQTERWCASADPYRMFGYQDPKTTEK